MAESAASWFCKNKGAWVAYELDISQKIEEAFCAFWRSGASSPVVWLSESGQRASTGCCIDFRTLEQISTTPDGSRWCCVVCRQEPSFAAADVCNQWSVQWGHAQDPVQNVGFAAYDADTSLLLEAGFTMHKAGAGMKGTMFTAANGCDYLVDFVKMHQTRMATRRVRHIYRHGICRGIRLGIEAGLSAMDAVAQMLGAIKAGAPGPAPEALKSFTEEPLVIGSKSTDSIPSLQLSALPTNCSDTCSSDREELESARSKQASISENDSETKRFETRSQMSKPMPSNTRSNQSAVEHRIKTSIFACMAGLASICNSHPKCRPETLAR